MPEQKKERMINDKNLGLMDQLFLFFSKDVKVTMLVILTLTNIFFMRKWIGVNDDLQANKDKMYERVIAEVKGEVNKQIRPIQNASERTNGKVDTLLSKADSTLNNVNHYIYQKKK